MKQKTMIVKVSPIDVQTMRLKLVGDTPLLMEKFSDATREQLKRVVEGKGREKRKNRDFDTEVKEKVHLLNGKPAFPTSAFKKCFVESAPYLDGCDKKLVKGSMFVIGELTPIKFKTQTVNKALGRDSGIKRAPREIWRPEFQNWSCELVIKFNASQITPQQIVELARLGGFHIGIGGWRPQCGGQYGMFSVVTK